MDVEDGAITPAEAAAEVEDARLLAEECEVSEELSQCQLRVRQLKARLRRIDARRCAIEAALPAPPPTPPRPAPPSPAIQRAAKVLGVAPGNRRELIAAIERAQRKYQLRGMRTLMQTALSELAAAGA